MIIEHFFLFLYLPCSSPSATSIDVSRWLELCCSWKASGGDNTRTCGCSTGRWYCGVRSTPFTPNSSTGEGKSFGVSKFGEKGDHDFHVNIFLEKYFNKIVFFLCATPRRCRLFVIQASVETPELMYVPCNFSCLVAIFLCVCVFV